MPTVRDIETRSVADLKKVGAYRYAEDASTEILVDVSKGEGAPVIAHNAAFERAVLNAKAGARLRPEDMDCTMARACAVGLPGSLEQLGKVLGCPVQKDKDGHRLMLKLCKPKKVHADGRIEWHGDEAEFKRLRAYCRADVLSEGDADSRVPRLSDRERRIWTLDQTINDRGFAVDLSAVRDGLSAVVESKRRADRKIWELTNGAVEKCTQTARIVAWIRSRGIPCESIAKGEVEEIVLRADIFDAPEVEEVVTLRRATTRMFRFDKILAQVCRDGRVRGVFQYHKAHTGRWAGWTQSFPRVDDPDTIEGVLGLLGGSAAVDLIELTYGPALKLLSQCLRPMVVAPPGRKLIGGDFSNIEGRVAAWFVNALWKLDAFRAYDDGTGPDLYVVTAGAMGSDNRQFGKVGELSGAYQGGYRATQRAAANAEIKMDETTARKVNRLWRDANVEIVDAWPELNDAGIQAVQYPGMVVPVLGDKVRYVCDGKFLYCRLPSGRTIHYASPSVRWKTHTINTEDGDEIELNSLGVTFWGVDGTAWRPIDLYGGMQFNHIVQGFARDLLVEAMFAVEKAGYEIVHHTHDDLVCEVDTDFGSAGEFSELMADAARKMAPGLPVSVKAWEGERWIK